MKYFFLFLFSFLIFSCSQNNGNSSNIGGDFFEELKDFETALKTSKENGKRTLIYFSAHASVNSRLVEDKVLVNSKIRKMMTENFSCYIAYVDSKVVDSKTGEVMGKKYYKLQSETFKTNYQPYFYIINDSGKVISEIGTTKSVEQFLDFLNKGLK